MESFTPSRVRSMLSLIKQGGAFPALHYAFHFLETNGAELTLVQKRTLFIVLLAAEKQATDTWDHAIDDDFSSELAWPQAADVLRRVHGGADG